MEDYFFELAIYRCSPKKFEKELDTLERKINDHFDDLTKQLEDYDSSHLKQDRFSRLSYEYEYNEVIGWIRLYILGNQIRGEYFYEVSPKDSSIQKPKINKGVRKKKFCSFEKAFELSIYTEDSSEDIFQKLLNKLEYLSKEEKPFKGRFIDTRQLETIGKFVNWRELVANFN